MDLGAIKDSTNGGLLRYLGTIAQHIHHEATVGMNSSSLRYWAHKPLKQ